MLVAPARKITKEELQPAFKSLDDWGFEVVIAKNMYGDHHQYSGTDA